MKFQLQQLVIIQKGKKPLIIEGKRFPDSIPYLDINAIENGHINQYCDSYSTVIARENDIFIVADGSRSGLVGKGIVGAVGSTIMCLTPILINKDFLFYFLKSQYNYFNSNTTGSTIPHLNKKIFDDLEVPFPSQKEQEAIVLQLDKRLNEYHFEFKNAENDLQKSKDYQKSILAQAVTGRLTNQYRNDLDSYKINNLPKSWQVKKLNGFITFIGSGSTPSGGSDNYLKNGIPFLRSQNVYPDELRLDDVAFISEEMHNQMKRSHVKSNDVLLNITGASIGRSLVIPPNFGEANVNQHVCIIRVTKDLIPQYLSLFLNSPIGQDLIMNSQTGVTRQGLNYSQIRSLEINYPPLNEQIEIVSLVAELLSNSLDMINQHDNKIKLIHQLQESVLQMAFSGELIKLDAKEESLNVILEKISKEKDLKIASLKELKRNQQKKKIFLMKINEKELKDFILKNYAESTFSSDELIMKLGITNKNYDAFKDILFSLIQEKINENENTPFLEMIYDSENKSQLLKIKN